VLERLWERSRTVVIHWTGTEYKAIATYVVAVQAVSCGEQIAGIDLGEVYMAASQDGAHTYIFNGRLLGSK
jgi:hypothetical protein